MKGPFKLKLAETLLPREIKILMKRYNNKIVSELPLDSLDSGYYFAPTDKYEDGARICMIRPLSDEPEF